MRIQQSIEQKLGEHFEGGHLTVENESHMHSVPPNSETHFKVTLISDQFEGQSRVRRHQAIYQALSEEMQGGVHALALHLFTPEEWEQAGGQVPDSPNCMGGSKREQAS
ncbi:BolA family protein [Marinobacter sp. M1N3S26]|uniref:BolA family protein n=1 Tax=unclassified Marinobacter TaxID=83889 RepID=UPI00387B0453